MKTISCVRERSGKPAAFLVAGAVAFGMAGRARADVPWTLDTATAGVDEGGSYSPPIFQMTGTPLGTAGIKLSGHLGPVDGSFSGNPDSYIPGLNAIFMSGSIGSAITAGDTLAVSSDFSFAFTGGVVTLYSVFLSANNGASFVSGQGLPGGPITPASGAVIVNQFESGAFAAGSTGGAWSLSLNFDWQGFAPTDTLTLSVPGNSIDIRLVPAPGALAAITLGMGAAVPRRRR